MTSSPKASVIIPTYRRRGLLRNAVASLAAQQTGHAFEIIVVNDAPDEDLSFLPAEFAGLDLKVLCPEHNVGRALARNIGVRNSQGEIIIFLDDDMTVMPGFIEAHVRVHTEPNLAVIGNIESAPEYAHHPLAKYVERQGAKKRKDMSELPARCFRTGNGSLARELFSEVGMFDESFSTYGEDLDLAMRLEDHKARFIFAREAVSYNHHPPDLNDMLAKLREWGRYTMPILAERHPDFARDIWLHLAPPVRLGRESFGLSVRKIAVRIAILRPFYLIARGIYNLTFLDGLLLPVIDYIRLYTYFNAYRQGLREKP
jgi:glycosyltransferase involved in cell wall biosynthesis